MHIVQKIIFIAGVSTLLAINIAAAVAYVCQPVKAEDVSRARADDDFQKQLELDSVGDEAAPDAGTRDAGKTVL